MFAKIPYYITKETSVYLTCVDLRTLADQRVTSFLAFLSNELSLILTIIVAIIALFIVIIIIEFGSCG